MNKALKLVLVITSCFFCLNCAQEIRDNTEVKEIVFRFKPSLSYESVFKVDFENETLSMKTFGKKRVYVEEEIDTLSPCYLYGCDTVNYNKVFQIEKSNFEAFARAEKLAGFNQSVGHARRRMDGIYLEIIKYDYDEDSVKLRSANPIRTKRFDIDYDLLDPFFNLTYTVVNDDEGVEILEWLQWDLNYYCVRLTHRKPIEHRVYNEVYGGCKISLDYLKSFMKKIPKTPLIFDCREGSIAHCLYWVLEEIANERDVYFYGQNKMSNCHSDVSAWLDAHNLQQGDYKMTDSSWKSFESNANLRYEKWLNNTNVKWFNTKEEVLSAINKLE